LLFNILILTNRLKKTADNKGLNASRALVLNSALVLFSALVSKQAFVFNSEVLTSSHFC